MRVSRFTEYRQHLERLGGRRRRLLKWLAFAVSALLAAVTLLTAGVDPGTWLGWVRQHTRSVPVKAGNVAPAPRAMLPVLPPQAIPMASAGTDSSVSTVPRDLILTGIVLGRNFKEGRAMIGVARENPQTYAAGALLANGARLTEIHPRFVVLERAGRSARLYLDADARTAPKQHVANELLTVGGVPEKKPALVMSTEPVTDYLRPTPVYDDADLVGYQVYPGANAGVFAQLGLQPGDVIISINGAPIGDPGQGVTLLEQLVGGSELPVTVRRKDQLIDMTLNGTVITQDQERTRQSAGGAIGSRLPGM
jgi:type II secretion system protein C